jgi:hypothetical protein
MHEIENLFEEQEVLRRVPQPSPDDDAGETPGPQGRFDFGFGLLSGVARRVSTSKPSSRTRAISASV